MPNSSMTTRGVRFDACSREAPVHVHNGLVGLNSPRFQQPDVIHLHLLTTRSPTRRVAPHAATGGNYAKNIMIPTWLLCFGGTFTARLLDCKASVHKTTRCTHSVSAPFGKESKAASHRE